MPYRSDTIAMTVLDPFTLDATFKKGGTVMGTAHAVMSKDGRTLTVTSKSQTNGQATNNGTVWEKGDGGHEVRSRTARSSCQTAPAQWSVAAARSRSCCSMSGSRW